MFIKSWHDKLAIQLITLVKDHDVTRTFSWHAWQVKYSDPMLWTVHSTIVLAMQFFISWQCCLLGHLGCLKKIPCLIKKIENLLLNLKLIKVQIIKQIP